MPAIRNGKEHELLTRWMRGNVEAVRLIESLAFVSHVWDDLVDRDVPVDQDSVSEAFRACLSDIPRNPFYVGHFAEIQPLIEQAMIDWLDSNRMERVGGHWLNVAYVLRDNLTNVVIRCAWVIGGHEWALSVAEEVRRYVYDEELEKYVKEHRNG